MRRERGPTPEEMLAQLRDAISSATTEQVEGLFHLPSLVEQYGELSIYGLDAQCQAADEYDGPKPLAIMAVTHSITNWDDWNRAVRSFLSPIELLEGMTREEDADEDRLCTKWFERDGGLR